MPPPPPPLYHHPAAVPHVVEEYSDHGSHGLGLADLFDISLTGIAFLSFGMFILQVLMCITMVSIFLTRTNPIYNIETGNTHNTSIKIYLTLGQGT